MAIPKIEVEIGARVNKLVAGLNDAESSINKFAGKAKKLGGILSLAVTAPLLLLGTNALRAASDTEEAFSKFDTIFRDVAKSAEQSFQILRNEYGLSSLEAKSLLGSTGDLLTGFGFSQQAALDLATGVQKLAVDLASFTNFAGGAEGASQALTKALLGERESIKSLGISINEEDVKKQVAINTAKGLTFETERQAKAYATLDLAVKQSGNAIGDYARTSDSFANQQRLLQARIQDISAELGTVFLPMVTKIVSELNGLVEKFQALTPETKKFIVVTLGITAAIGPVLLGVGTLIKLLPILRLAFTAMTGPVGIAIGILSAATIGIIALASSTGLSDIAIEKHKKSMDSFKTAADLAAEATSLITKANSEFGIVSTATTAKIKEAIKAKIEDVKATLLQAEAANKLAVAEAKKESLFDIIVGFERVSRRVNKVQGEGATAISELHKTLNELTFSYIKIGSEINTVNEEAKKLKRTFEDLSKLPSISPAKGEFESAFSPKKEDRTGEGKGFGDSGLNGILSLIHI